MNNPDQLEKLRASLKEAIPEPNNMCLSWAELEKIDYLVIILLSP